jgi:P27 family predicted phage terminase small subunit
LKSGPLPKAASLKRLSGNPGKRAILDAPKPPPKRLRVPAWLSDAAKAAWRDLSPVLFESGLLTSGDKMTLALLCEAFADYREASMKVKERGKILTSEKGGLYQNPWLAVRAKAFDQVCRLAGQFGLDPSSRGRLDVPSEPQQLSLAEILFEGQKDDDS